MYIYIYHYIIYIYIIIYLLDGCLGELAGRCPGASDLNAENFFLVI